MWTQPQNQLLPWMQSLSRKLDEYGFPDLRGDKLWVGSDYVFGNKNSDFDIVSVVLVSPERTGCWHQGLIELREKSPLGNRRMGFKSLGDSIRRNALVPFLKAAEHISGTVVSIAIDKAVTPRLLFTPEQLQDVSWCRAKWRPVQLNRMCLVAHFAAFLVAGLTKDSQNLMWISDQDDIFANATFSLDTGNTFTRFLNAYSAHSYGNIAIGTTQICEPDLFEEDLAAIADITAGGTAELLTEIKNQNGVVPHATVKLQGLPYRTQVFWDWFSDQRSGLKKIGCTFEQRGTALHVSAWQ
ncbi:hypothetical protein N9L06_00205 [Mariniblastus sp.]|nr:hypothetical protein [Mariniblastus sp.]